MPVVPPEPQPPGPLLDHLAAPLVGHQADAVEEHVGGDLQRPRQRERAVRHVAGVLERHAADGQLAAVEQDGRRGDQAALERRRGGDQLERRSRRIQALGRAVGERRAVVGVLQALVDGRAHALGEHVGVVARVAAEPDHLAAARVHRDEAARQAVAARAPPGRSSARRSRSTGAAACPARGRAPTARPSGGPSRPPARGWRRCARAGSGRTGTRCPTARRGRRAPRPSSAAGRAASPSPRRSCRTGARRSPCAGTCAGTPARPRRRESASGSPAGTGPW